MVFQLTALQHLKMPSLGVHLTWIIVLGWSSLGSAAEAKKAQQQPLPKQTSTVRVCTTEWPPFEYIDEHKKIAGFDVDTVKAVFKRMGKHVVLEHLPWARCLHHMKFKSADAIFTLRYTKERAEMFYFPEEPISLSENLLFFRKKDKTAKTSATKLEGKRIGGVLGYQYGDFFTKNTAIIKDWSKDDVSGFEKLLHGRTDFFLCDKLVGLFVLKKLGLEDKIGYISEPVTTFKMFIAFSKKPENLQLSQEFSTALKAMKVDGTYQKIQEKWGDYKEVK